MFPKPALVCVSVLLLASGAAASSADAQPAAALSGAEARLMAPLVKAIDELAAASAGADGQVSVFDFVEKTRALSASTAPPLALSWHHAVLKAAGGKVYVPFVVGAEAKTLPSVTVTAYLRVLDSAGATAYENYFTADFRGGAQQESRLSRALAVVPGRYVALFGLRFEGSPRSGSDVSPEPAEATAQVQAPAGVERVYVLRKELEIEDLWGDNLTTSTVFLANRVEALKTPLSPEALAERPFVIGAVEIVPAFGQIFRKTDELTVFFQVYNAGLGSGEQPDVSVDYLFERLEGDSYVAFKRVPTQTFNARTLPPNFDPSVGHQLSAGWAVPLASFPVGEYRLAVTIADKVKGTNVSRALTFTVAGI